jgi:predicted deacylase
VLDALKELAKDAIVVFASDHVRREEGDWMAVEESLSANMRSRRHDRQLYRALQVATIPVWRAPIGAGYRVRALLRSTSKRMNLAGLAVEIVECGMLDAAAVARAIAGTRFLFHVAAVFRHWARTPEEILVNNREGTRLLMQAALAAGVERVPPCQ